LHSPFIVANASLFVYLCLHGCAVACDSCATKQTFAQCIILLKGTLVRGTNILHNVIASGYVTFYEIKKFFVNILLFLYWQSFFADRIWTACRNLETLSQTAVCLKHS